MFLFLGDVQSVRGWFERVGQLPACEAAAQRVLHGKGPALKSFLQKQPAPHIQRKDSANSANAAEVHNVLMDLVEGNLEACVERCDGTCLQCVCSLDRGLAACDDGGRD